MHARTHAHSEGCLGAHRRRRSAVRAECAETPQAAAGHPWASCCLRSWLWRRRRAPDYATCSAEPAGRQTDRQTNKQTKQTNKQTNRAAISRRAGTSVRADAQCVPHYRPLCLLHGVCHRRAMVVAPNGMLVATSRQACAESADRPRKSPASAGRVGRSERRVRVG